MLQEIQDHDEIVTRVAALETRKAELELHPGSAPGAGRAAAAGVVLDDDPFQTAFSSRKSPAASESGQS